MDRLGAGHVLRRGGQRAAVGQARRVERPAVPHAPRRSEGAVRIEIPAAENPPHTHRTTRSQAYHRHRPHTAGAGRNRAGNAPQAGPRLPVEAPRGVPRHRAGDRERRLCDDHLHVGHHGRSQGRRADAPQLHGQRRAVALAHRHSVVVPDAHHTAAGPLLRARRGVLHHDRMRRHGGDGAGRRDADGDAQEHSAEYPRSAPALPAVGAGAGQEFPQEHRGFDPRQGPLHGAAVQSGAPHGLPI